MSRLFILIAALFAIAPATAATTAPAVSATDGVAIQGYDPVAFFTAGAPQKGQVEPSYEYEGATWRFASSDSLATFMMTSGPHNDGRPNLRCLADHC